MEEEGTHEYYPSFQTISLKSYVVLVGLPKNFVLNDPEWGSQTVSHADPNLNSET